MLRKGVYGNIYLRDSVLFLYCALTLRMDPSLELEVKNDKVSQHTNRIRWSTSNQEELYIMFFQPLFRCLEYLQTLDWERDMEEKLIR